MDIQNNLQDQFQKIIKAEFLEKLVAQFSGIGIKEKTNFFRLLAVSQKAGLGVRESLQAIFKTEKNTGMRIIIADLIKQLTQWSQLSKALENHPYAFESSETELIKSSEMMGNMPDTLNEISNDLENDQKIQSKIKSSMMYPITLLLFAVLAVAVLLIKVVPTIVDLFPDKSKLPDITKLMISTSDFLIVYWWMILLIVVGVVITYMFLYANILVFKVVIDKLFIVIPVVGDVTKTFYMYRFSKLMSDFNKAGVGPVATMNQIAEIFDNYHFKRKIMEIKKDLEAWFGYAEAMEGSDLFDPLLIQIILVGENTGNMGEVLGRMSFFYKDLLMTKIATLMGFIEPIMMALIAVIIGGIVWSIFLPLADLVNVIWG